MNRSPGVPVAMLLLTVLSLELLPFFAIRSLKPPDPVPETALETEFSSARAAKHVAAIAREPHPPGTPSHARVREYIVWELEKLGLQTRIQEVRSIHALGPNREEVPLKNILARILGTSGSKAILLSAHYDTCPIAPGAADNSASVAAILETARALKASPQLRNDIIFLFTDGEEQQLLGAFGFVEEDGWASEVGLALNFEARGNSGPSIMFETSRGNASLIREFAHSAPYPVSNSLADTVYKWLPNITDFTEYKKVGIPGFNFALIDGFHAYHTALDTPENLSEAGLQHHGSYALSLARHFGNLALNESDLESRTDAIYFNVWGRLFVYYDGLWALPLAVLTAIVFAATVFRRGVGVLCFNLGVQGVLVTLSWTILVSILTTITVGYLAHLADRLGISMSLLPRGETLGSTLVTLSLWNIALALTSLFCHVRRRKITIEIASIGYAVQWLVLCLITSILVPGGSFLFTWPLLLALPVYWIILTRKHEEPHSRLNALVIFLCGIPALILLSQALYLFFLALIPDTTMGVFIVVFLSVQTLGLLLPQLELAASRCGWALPATGGLGALVCYVSGVLASVWGF